MSMTLTTALEHLSSADPFLGYIIRNSTQKPDFTPHKNYYQTLVDSIVSQQLSVKAAATIEKRFIDLFDGADFPTPEQILTKDIEILRSAGLSRPKAGYIQDLAMKVIDGTVQFDHLDALSNEEIITELTKVKGIGEWTVHMFLMFCMGRLDVLPSGDLGIRNGIKKLYDLPTIPTPLEIQVLAQKNNWHPYESVASWYIWKSLDATPTI